MGIEVPRRGIACTLSTLLLPRLAPSVVSRPILTAKLSAAAASSAIWVNGPAGAGKTTAVVQWLKARKKNVCWLRLDASDNDPGVLLPRVAEAFAPYLSESPGGIAYGSEHRNQLARFSRYFFRQLFSKLKRVVTWVIDNAQDVDNNVLELILAAAIDECPEKLTIVIISRGEPSELLARQLIHRQLVAVGCDSLKFSVDEASALFTKLSIEVPQQVIARYCRLLDGWAVGLVLAGDVFKHTGYPEELSSEQPLEAPALAAYFAADVFDRLPAEQQTILLSTAYCTNFTAAQAAELSQLVACGVALEELHRKSGFVEIDERSERYYTVHPVFRSYLLRRVETEYEFERVVALKRNTARILLESDQYAQAVQIFRSLRDNGALAAIVESSAQELIDKGLDQTVIDVVSAMSPSAATHWTPWVRFWHAEALAHISPARANSEASAARHAFEVAGDTLGLILASGTLLSLHRTVRLDIADPISIAERCEALFTARWAQFHAPSPLDIFAAAAYLGAISTLNRGTVIPTEICDWLLAVVQREGAPSARLRLATVLHEQLYIRNDVVRTRSVEIHAARICEMPECRAVARRTWYVGLAIGRIYQRRLEEAVPALEIAAQLATELSDLESLCHVNAWRIVLACRLRRPNDGLAWLLSSNPDFGEVAPLIRANLLWAEGNLYIALRHFDTALLRFSAAIQLYRETNTNVEQGPMIWLGQSICQLMLGRYESAIKSIEPLETSSIGGTARRRLDAFTTAIRASIALLRNESGADEKVSRAVSLIRETDYRDVLHGAEPMLAEICARAILLGIEIEYVDGLIQQRQLDAPPDAPAEWPYPIRIRALGELHIETRTPEASDRAMRKSIELLHQLIAALPDAAAVDPLIAKLWPGDGREGAQKAFDAALHRLRKRFGSEHALRLSEKRLSFGRSHVYLDISHLFSLLENNNFLSVAQVELCFDLYRNHLLPSVSDATVELQRGRLWQRFEQQMSDAIATTKAQGDEMRAATWQRKLDALSRTAPANVKK